MVPVAAVAVWAIAAGSIIGMFARPWRVPEWVWATSGACALVAFGLIGVRDAASAVRAGGDVYAFLIGIMALSELLRREGVFAWFAGAALRAARGSRLRLFVLVYAAGTVVTVLLSNDTTAVVLTPAVMGALLQTDADPLPYVYACAFVANAASFVLPFSNPANLVVFGSNLEAVIPWVSTYGLASLAAIGITFACLALVFYSRLRSTYAADVRAAPTSARTRFAAWIVATAGAVLVLASSLRWDVGIASFAAAAVAVAVVTFRDHGAPSAIVSRVAWGIIPLVAGLFVIVRSLDSHGAIGAIRYVLLEASHAGALAGNALVAAVLSVLDVALNNLPVALGVRYALESEHVPALTSHAALVAIDLGPNLSVTGSLATILWLIALRRGGIIVTPLQFFRIGLVVTLPALLGAALLVR